MSTAVTRARRSCLAVPGSSQKFIDKARTLPADQVFLDLEDACAPLAKPGARKTIVAALNEGGWGDRLRVVRVNDWTTEWTYRDVTEVVEGAGANLDAIMLPKVQTPQQVVALDLLLTQIEKAMGYEVGRIGIEAQIENALGLIERQRDRDGVPAGRDDHLRAGRLHGLDQHEEPGGGGAAARLRRRRRLPPHPHEHPHGRPRARQAGHRRAVPADQGRRRVPAGGRALGGAGLRRQVGAAPGPDRRGERDVLADPGRLRPRREHPRRLRVLHVRGRREARRRDDRRRDDRRGEPQDGAGDQREGPRGGDGSARTRGPRRRRDRRGRPSPRTANCDTGGGRPCRTSASRVGSPSATRRAGRRVRRPRARAGCRAPRGAGGAAGAPRWGARTAGCRRVREGQGVHRDHRLDERRGAARRGHTRCGPASSRRARPPS